MIGIIKYILFLISFHASIQLATGSLIILQDTSKGYVIKTNRLEIFEDHSRKLSLAQIIQGPQLYNFIHNENPEGYNINPSAVYWLRFKIKNETKAKTKWLLEILDSRFEKITLYTPEVSNPLQYDSSITGTAYPFNKREYAHKNFIFDLTTISDTNSYYYLKIDSKTMCSFLFKISKNKEFYSYSTKEYLLLGMYYGILFIMAFYNLFLFFSIREKVYIYYFFYVLSWAFNSTMEDGLGFQFIWSKYSFISYGGWYSSKIILLMLYILYLESFLDIKKNLPPYSKKLFQVLILFSVLNIIFNYFNMTISNHLILIITFSYLLYIARKVYSKDHKYAQYFLLGNSIIVIGWILTTIESIPYIKVHILRLQIVNTIFYYSKNICMVLDIVILSFALGEKIKFLKDSAAKAQQKLIDHLNENNLLSEKINKALEEKVAQRTRTIEEKNNLLEDAYEKVKQQADEISRINAILDRDNWNLKNKIKEEKEARLNSHEINFKEFSQVYTNEDSCFHLLEALKWNTGYSCRKCNNTKFNKGLTPFSRRCSKCRYDESITAFTVFHGVKFEITKALYITIIINRYGDTLSITDISKELELRNATCWKFFQKVTNVRNKKEFEKVNENEKLKFLILNSDL